MKPQQQDLQPREKKPIEALNEPNTLLCFLYRCDALLLRCARCKLDLLVLGGVTGQPVIRDPLFCHRDLPP
jgi:hypothetical protein